MDGLIHESVSNSFYSIEIFSALGTNTEQEDAIGYVMRDMSAVLILCDGMGGMNGGKASAQAAVSKVKELAESEAWETNPLDFLKRVLETADDEVYFLKDENGERIGGGCTIVIAVVVGRRIYYANVGDSRIYYWDGNSFIQLTQDHNYGEVLIRKLQSGEIDNSEYDKEKGRAAALTGFLGLGELKEYFICEAPIMLDRSQVICLQTDGLYKLLAESEMQNIIFSNAKNLEQAGEQLLKRAEEKKRNYQDNTSMILMRLK